MYSVNTVIRVLKNILHDSVWFMFFTFVIIYFNLLEMQGIFIYTYNKRMFIYTFILIYCITLRCSIYIYRITLYIYCITLYTAVLCMYSTQGVRDTVHFSLTVHQCCVCIVHKVCVTPRYISLSQSSDERKVASGSSRHTSIKEISPIYDSDSIQSCYL